MKDLFLSRKFWVALFALVVVVIAAFVPGFELDTEEAAGFLIIIVAYLVGVAVDPGPGGWKGVLQSRKFWAAVVGVVLLFFNAFHLVLPFDLSADQVVSMAVLIGGYIAGVAMEKPKTLTEPLGQPRMDGVMAKEVWIAIANQVPALAAFTIAIVIIVIKFVSAITKVTTSWQTFIERQNEATTKALQEITKQLREMSREIREKIDDRGDKVEERICAAIYSVKQVEDAGRTEETGQVDDLPVNGKKRASRVKA